jgi:hypothetical protein
MKVVRITKITRGIVNVVAVEPMLLSWSCRWHRSKFNTILNMRQTFYRERTSIPSPIFPKPNGVPNS